MYFSMKLKNNHYHRHHQSSSSQLNMLTLNSTSQVFEKSIYESRVFHVFCSASPSFSCVGASVTFSGASVQQVKSTLAQPDPQFN